MENNPMPSLLDHIYPIGSIYMNVDSINPNETLGGTWERIYDRFLIGASNNYSVGTIGGESVHTLTTSEMPSHIHVGLTIDNVFTLGGWDNYAPGSAQTGLNFMKF